MATVQLGLKPFDLGLTLSTDADFLSTLVNPAGWATGIVIQLVLLPAIGAPITWTAVISGNNATWSIPAAQVNTTILANVQSVRLHYIDASGNNLLWGRGGVYLT